MASGIPSNRAQISPITARSAVVNSSDSSPATARSQNNATASGTTSDGTGTTRSPGSPNGSRLVANTVTVGTPPTTAPINSLTAPITCSQVSTINNRRRPRNQSTIDSTIVILPGRVPTTSQPPPPPPPPDHQSGPNR